MQEVAGHIPDPKTVVGTVPLGRQEGCTWNSVRVGRSRVNDQMAEATSMCLRGHLGPSQSLLTPPPGTPLHPDMSELPMEDEEEIQASGGDKPKTADKTNSQATPGTQRQGEVSRQRTDQTWPEVLHGGRGSQLEPS